MKAGDIRCRLCKANAFECGGYLHRVNEKGVPGIWECRPSCEVDMSTADAIIAAIKAGGES